MAKKMSKTEKENIRKSLESYKETRKSFKPESPKVELNTSGLRSGLKEIPSTRKASTTTSNTITFKEAFANAKKQGLKTFEWNGKKYTTEEKNKASSTTTQPSTSKKSSTTTQSSTNKKSTTTTQPSSSNKSTTGTQPTKAWHPPMVLSENYEEPKKNKNITTFEEEFNKSKSKSVKKEPKITTTPQNKNNFEIKDSAALNKNFEILVRKYRKEYENANGKAPSIFELAKIRKRANEESQKMYRQAVENKEKTKKS